MQIATKVLEDAKNLIDTVGWCQKTLSKFDPATRCHTAYCCLGAIMVKSASPGVFNEELITAEAVAEDCFRMANGISSIGSWNDEPTRTKEQVIAAFDKAIAYSKEHDDKSNNGT